MLAFTRLDGRRRRVDRHGRAAGRPARAPSRSPRSIPSRSTSTTSPARWKSPPCSGPHIEIEDGLVKTIDMPTNTFYCHEPANLVLFVGKEPNLRWRTFGECIFRPGRARWASAGSCSSARSAGRCRTPASRGCTSPAPTPTLLAGDGAVRRSPQRLRRPRLVHQLPDDAGRIGRDARWSRWWPRSPATCRAPTR